MLSALTSNGSEMRSAESDTTVIVATKDGDVAVHDLGGEGPTIVYAHATGFHGLVWKAVHAELADAFHGVSFDQRGHGDSRVPEGWDCDWRHSGHDIVAIVERLGFQPTLGVGHSSGATALLLAEQSRPSTFTALYCYEPIIVPADPPLGADRSNWLAEATRRRREVFASRAEAYASYASKAPFASWDRAVLAAYVDYGFADQPDGTVMLKCRRENEARYYEMATAHDAFGRLPEVACPVMLACGSESDAVKVTDLAALASRFQCAWTDALPGLGHLGPLEDPPAVAASIRVFWTRVRDAVAS